MTTTNVLAAIIMITITAATEIGGTGTGTGTVDANVITATVTVVAGNEVETASGIGIGIEAEIEVGMMMEKGSGYVSADLPANSSLRTILTRRWASGRVGGRKSRENEAGIASASLGQAEIRAHEAHNTKEGICDNDNICPVVVVHLHNGTLEVGWTCRATITHSWPRPSR